MIPVLPKKAIGFLLIADRFFAPFADAPIPKTAVLEPKAVGCRCLARPTALGWHPTAVS